MKVLGLDVGNAKLKLCYVESDGVLAESGVRWHGLPLATTPDRIRGFEIGVPSKVRMTGQLFGFDPHALDAVVVCSSNSYSFPLLHESVPHLAGVLLETFGPTPVYLVAADGCLTTAGAISALDATALSAFTLTNFVGSATLGARLIRDGLSIDIGTTSTEVMPIVDGRVDPVGLAAPHDYVRFRYTHHRLGWYGLTWTPLVMLAPEITTPAATYQMTARAHRTDLLFAFDECADPELMREHAYHHAFPDRDVARAGLCELVGLDRRLLPDAEIEAVRGFLYDRLVERVAAMVRAVAAESFARPLAELDVALFGLGEQVLARPALLRAGVNPGRIRTLALGRAQGLWSASSAFGVALLGLEQALGRRVEVK